MYIYDSVKKKKVKFIPIDKNIVKVYVCGPTVYDDAHLGHARSSVSFDILHRTLLANNYKVIMVKNFTDIDDKIIKKINETQKSLEKITSYYINSYKEDMKALNILPNTIEPKATEHISYMIDMIKTLLEKGIAYTLDDGIYFDTSKDEFYGCISHREANLEVQNNKKNPQDFALWKFKDDISYYAPFGNGRPGWHIECSAMIDKHLNSNDTTYSIDIHGGGADLLFPHHENEASQSRCVNNKELSKYWMHNGFVQIDNEKMSKSLGNSFFVKDLLKNYSGEVIRFYLLTAHYRSNFNFNTLDLESSKKRLDKLYRLKKQVFNIKSKVDVDKNFKEKLLNCLNDDLNTPVALSIIDEFINESNEILPSANKTQKYQIVANLEYIQSLLGLGYQDPFKYFRFGLSEDFILKVENLIKKRQEAKKNKDYSLADLIREDLNKLGINIMDTPNGTLWEKI